MKIRKYLDEASIDLDLDVGAADLDPEMAPEKRLRILKERCIERIADLLDASDRTGKVGKLYLDLLNREKKATTALGGGIAMPHVRSRQARGLVMAVALSREGIDFGAPDGRPVRIFIALVAPAHDDRLYLRAVQQLAELFVEQPGEWGPKEALLHAEETEDVYWALSGIE